MIDPRVPARSPPAIQQTINSTQQPLPDLAFYNDIVNLSGMRFTNESVSASLCTLLLPSASADDL